MERDILYEYRTKSLHNADLHSAKFFQTTLSMQILHYKNRNVQVFLELGCAIMKGFFFSFG